MGEEVVEAVIEEKQKIKEDASKEDMKVIKGLEKRLYSLEQLKMNAEMRVKSLLEYAEV